MNLNAYAEFAYSLLRAVAGLLFFHHGAQKLLGWFGGVPPEHGGPPPLLSQMGVGGVLELAGGLLVLVGLFTRPVAFLLSGLMAVAYWQFHAPLGAWPIVNQGEPAVLYSFLFLFIAAQGGGWLSVDALRERSRSKGARRA